MDVRGLATKQGLLGIYTVREAQDNVYRIEILQTGDCYVDLSSFCRGFDMIFISRPSGETHLTVIADDNISSIGEFNIVYNPLSDFKFSIDVHDVEDSKLLESWYNFSNDVSAYGEATIIDRNDRYWWYVMNARSVSSSPIVDFTEEEYGHLSEYVQSIRDRLIAVIPDSVSFPKGFMMTKMLADFMEMLKHDCELWELKAYLYGLEKGRFRRYPNGVESPLSFMVEWLTGSLRYDLMYRRLFYVFMLYDEDLDLDARILKHFKDIRAAVSDVKGAKMPDKNELILCDKNRRLRRKVGCDY